MLFFFFWFTCFTCFAFFRSFRFFFFILIIINIISEKISSEFAKVISEWFEEADNEIEYFRNELDQLSKEVVCLQEHLDDISN